MSAEDFNKVRNAYYNAHNAVLARPGENFQLFTPYKVLAATNDPASANEGIARLVDSIPSKKLFEGPSGSTPPPLQPPKPEDADASAVKPLLTAGHKAQYEYMLAKYNQAVPSEDKFFEILGDSYDSPEWKDWISFKRAYMKNITANNGKIDDATLDNCMEEWVDTSYDGANGESVKAAYYQSYSSPYVKANHLLVAFDAGVESYDEFYYWTYESIKEAVDKGSSATISFDETTKQTDIEHTWASGEAGFLCDIFEVGGEASYDKVTEKIQNSKLEVTLTIDHVAAFDIATYRGSWFYDPIVTEARGMPDNFATKEDYARVFGDGTSNGPAGSIGTMVFNTGQLIVGKGITCTMMMYNDFDQSETQTITTKAEGGIFPFFEASGEGGNTQTHTYFSSDGLKITTSTVGDSLWALGFKVNNVFD